MTQLPNNFFAAQCPPGTVSVSQTHIFAGEDPIVFHDYDGVIICAFNPGEGFVLVSLASEITEEQAGEIVEKACGYYTTYFKEPDDMTNVEIIHHERPINGSKITWKRTNKITWFNYLSETHVPETEFDTALESFRSLLKYHSLNEATTLIIKQVK